MAAMMAQIEYGDWQNVESSAHYENVAREAALRFCPWRLTHLALDHDLSLLQCKLEDLWKTHAGKSKEQCARAYIGIAQQLSYYGTTAFQAEVRLHSNS